MLNIVKALLGGIGKAGFLIMMGGWIGNTFLIPMLPQEYQLASRVILSLLGVVGYMIASWISSNRANNHRNPEEAEADIVGDIFVVLTIFAFALIWTFFPFFREMNVVGNGYYITQVFFWAMSAVSIFELIVTVRNALLNMYRASTLTRDAVTG